MALHKLSIFSVRNINEISIILSPAINFFYGENGSGKSALIEAIFLLGRAKSFRVPAIKAVINSDDQQLTVSGVVKQNDSVVSVGVRLTEKDIEIHINQQPTQKRIDLLYLLPMQLFHPKSYELLDAGGQARREFLDWGLFNSRELFLSVWRRFKKVLAYRNHLLKKNLINQLDIWNNELVDYGMQITSFREQYVNQLKPVFVNISQEFLPNYSIDLKLLRGWNDSLSYTQALIDDFARDLHNGFTHSGPHRCDFQVMVNGKLAKTYASRGQLKLLVISLLLAQIQLLINSGGNLPIVLIDDFAAELDWQHREKLLRYLAGMKCQLFATAIDKADFGSLANIDNYKMFHVEQGYVVEI